LYCINSKEVLDKVDSFNVLIKVKDREIYFGLDNELVELMENGSKNIKLIVLNNISHLLYRGDPQQPMETRIEFKRLDDSTWEDTILENYKKAIKKKAKHRRVSEVKLKKEIANFYGYTEKEKEVPRGYSRVFTNETRIHAVDILIHEKMWDIHRDDILGDIDRKGIADVRNFRKLHNIMVKDDDLRRNINKVLKEFIDALQDEKKDIWEKEALCDDLKQYIIKTYNT
jgi:hypothetical protein